MRGGGRFLQAVDAFNLSTMRTGALVGNGKHSAFRQLLGTLCRVSLAVTPSHFFESGFWDAAREQQQQRLSTGVSSAITCLGCGELHAEDDEDFASSRAMGPASAAKPAGPALRAVMPGTSPSPEQTPHSLHRSVPWMIVSSWPSRTSSH